MRKLIINLENQYAIIETQNDCFELVLKNGLFSMRHYYYDNEPIETVFTKEELITKTDLNPLVRWAGKGLLGIPQ